MMAMTPSLRWTDVALRLALTIGASMLLGYNRSEHGKAAGMRTTLLVCLAAGRDAASERPASHRRTRVQLFRHE
jgi:uncharacterized membrane protein YhiD involved in acid resistance